VILERRRSPTEEKQKDFCCLIMRYQPTFLSGLIDFLGLSGIGWLSRMYLLLFHSLDVVTVFKVALLIVDR
jgi:hypothetical protein